MKQQVSIEKKKEEKIEDSEMPAAQVQVEIVDEPAKEEKKEEDDVKDSWDADTTEDEQEEEGIVLQNVQFVKSSKSLINLMVKMEY